MTKLPTPATPHGRREFSSDAEPPCLLYDAVGSSISSADSLGPHGVLPRRARGEMASSGSGRLRAPNTSCRLGSTAGIRERRRRKHARNRRPVGSRTGSAACAALASPFSFGDRAVATLNTHAQRRRVSLGKAGNTQGVSRLAIHLGLMNADRRAVERRRVFGVEPRGGHPGFRLRFWRGELNRPIARFGGGLIDRRCPERAG